MPWKSLPGARLIDMDFFTELAKENNLKKLDSVERSKLIIDEETDELEKQLMFMIFFRSLRALTEDFARFRRKSCFSD